MHIFCGSFIPWVINKMNRQKNNHELSDSTISK